MTLLTLLLITSPVFSSIEVNGTVNYHNEDKTPLVGVKVLLKDLNGNIVAEEISGTDGEYSFQNVNPGDYILTAESDMSFDVVDMEDVYNLLLHLLGQNDFDEMQLLAADINQDNAVDWNDYWDMVIQWYLYGEEYMIGDLIFDEQIISIGAEQLKSAQNTNVSASSSGDTTDGNPLPTIKNEKRKFELILNEEIIVTNHSTKDIYLRNIKEISGFGLILNIVNASSIIDEITTLSKDMKYVITDNQVRINYINSANETLDLSKPLLIIKFFESSQSQSINVDKESHFLGSDGTVVTVNISIPKNILNEPESKLNSVYPNPMTEFANINFDLAQTESLRTEVYTVYGQLVASIDQGSYASGTSEIILKRNELNLKSGTYIVRLIADKSNKVIGSRSIIIQ